MHTEWIDLKLASDKLASQSAGDGGAHARADAQAASTLTANGWLVSRQVR